eukprot:scaffold14.g1214.t1
MREHGEGREPLLGDQHAIDDSRDIEEGAAAPAARGREAGAGERPQRGASLHRATPGSLRLSRRSATASATQARADGAHTTLALKDEGQEGEGREGVREVEVEVLTEAVAEAAIEEHVFFDVRANFFTLVAVTGVILFWRGVWNTWDYFFGTGNLYSELGSLLLGLGIMLAIRIANVPLANGLPGGDMKADLEMGKLGGPVARKPKGRRRGQCRLPLTVGLCFLAFLLFFTLLGSRTHRSGPSSSGGSGSTSGSSSKSGGGSRKQADAAGGAAAEREGAAASAGSGGGQKGAAGQQPKLYTFRIVKELPHDPGAFTQGLQFDRLCEGGKGGRCREVLWESTGFNGQSSMREVDLVSGRVRRARQLPQQDFGEGVARLYQLTWQSPRIWSYHSPLKDGWGITADPQGRLIVGDSSDKLFVIDPSSMEVLRTISVSDGGQPVPWLNELEWVDGQIYANIWQRECIAIIDPQARSKRRRERRRRRGRRRRPQGASGRARRARGGREATPSEALAGCSHGRGAPPPPHSQAHNLPRRRAAALSPPAPQSGAVAGWASLAGLRATMLEAAAKDKPRGGRDADVLNGIAWDAQQRRLFVTGKLWARLYEVSLVPAPPDGGGGGGGNATAALAATRRRCIVTDTRIFG